MQTVIFTKNHPPFKKGNVLMTSNNIAHDLREKRVAEIYTPSLAKRIKKEMREKEAVPWGTKKKREGKNLVRHRTK